MAWHIKMATSDTGKAGNASARELRGLLSDIAEANNPRSFVSLVLYIVLLAFGSGFLLARLQGARKRKSLVTWHCIAVCRIQLLADGFPIHAMVPIWGLYLLTRNHPCHARAGAGARTHTPMLVLVHSSTLTSSNSSNNTSSRYASSTPATQQQQLPRS